MAAYAALVSLMNNINQIMNHPRLSTSLDNEHIQPLLEKAGLLLDFIENNSYGGGSKEAEDLDRQIASAAHAAEDVIESHIVDLIHGGTSEARKASKARKASGASEPRKIPRRSRRFWDLIFGGCCQCSTDLIHGETSEASLPCSPDLQQIIHDMDAIMEKATEVKKKLGSGEDKPIHPVPVMESGESGMVGFDDELLQLLDELTRDQFSRHTISIVGMGGMGKTTLAKQIYGHSNIKHHFDIRAWASISQQYKVKEILSQLLSSLGESTNETVDATVDALGEKLHKTLYGRRHLIILDDIWSVEAWDKVRRYLPDDGNIRSRVVLTTRLSNVASDICGSSCFQMNLLDEDKSWKLFCEKALFPQIDDPPQLADVGKEIARLCKGLALSIVVIGGLLLKSPRNVQYWEDVAKDLKSIPNSKRKQESFDVLSLSYTHLPPHLKPCFLYMGVFKEDSHIHISKVINLWIAEGFLKPIGSRILEEVAEGYLKDLIDRNLVFVSSRCMNGKIGSCGIHDLLRELCIKVGEEQEFFHVTRSEMQGTERRFIKVDTDFSHGLSRIECRNPVLRSIITDLPYEKSVKHRLVRVWDEDGQRRSEEALYGNVNLRYLAYGQRHLRVWHLPTSVSLVWNLQFLIINRYSSNLLVAPFEIWNMRQLRHVKCYQIYLPDPLPSNREGDLLILDNLRTFKRAVNLRLCEDVCKRIPNINKLHLLYDREVQGYDDSLIDEYLCNLDHLHRLESLQLDMGIETNSWPSRDTDLIKKITFPRLLNKLTLSNCKLHWEDISVIGSLPQLEILELESFSVTEGERWSPIHGQFCRLKFLKIVWCDLLHWDADSSHFPALEKLVIELMTDLIEIPLEFSEIPTLELIRVDNCSNSTAISAVKIKEDQLESQGNDGLQVQVRLYDSNLESFKERLETEGLTINNIQLEIM